MDGVGICVEGVTDVWRLGRKAFALFGIEYKRQQVQIIKKIFKKVFVIFDSGEEQAQNKANMLVSDLQMIGVEAYQVILEKGDPGELSEEEARYIVKNLIKFWM